MPVTLHGIQDTPSKPSEITVNQLLTMEKDEAIWGAVQLYAMDTPTDSGMTPLPKGFQKLVDQYVELFAEPTGVPPVRSHTHAIPLLPGAQPFR